MCIKNEEFSPNLMHWVAQFFSAALEKMAAESGARNPQITVFYQ